MPTYHARNITVRLGSMPLDETTTSNIVLKKGEVAKRQGEVAEKKLLRSPYLPEKHVSLSDSAEDFELNWIGDAPFMQVQADANFTHLPGPHSSFLGLSTLEDKRPQAFALHVKLSDRAFDSGFSDKTHLKIEVLFNGQLSTCSLIHNVDIRSGAKSLHQVFAGYRVDFLAERPWVLLPSLTAADGGTRKLFQTVSPSERWKDLSIALRREAEDRGTNKHGESPPSARFLHALACMQPPPCVANLQQPGGKTFGLVDVVITAGTGYKPTTGTTYLKRPQKLRDPSYAVRSQIELSSKNISTETNDGCDVPITASSRTAWNQDDAVEGLDEEVDLHDKRPFKAQANHAVGEISQHATQSLGVQRQLSQIPILLSPSRVASLQSPSPITSRTSSRCPSPEHCRDGYKQPLPSVNCGRADNPTDLMRESQESEGNTSIPEGCDAPLSSFSLSTSQPPHLPVTSGSSIFHPQMNSMPLAPTLNDLSGYNSQSFASSYPSIPYYPPESSMDPTTASWSMPPTPSASPYYHQPLQYPHQALPDSLHLGAASHIPPNGMPGLLLQTSPYVDRTGSVTTQMPFTRGYEMCGPLPPTAMFSVTAKPRRSVSPTKKTTVARSTDLGNDLLVSRLVITGFGGKSVVDHAWRPPQIIHASQKCRSEDLVYGHAKAPDVDFMKTDFKSSTQKWSRTDMEASPLIFRAGSPSKKLRTGIAEQGIRRQRRDSQQDCQINPVLLPYLKRHQGPTNEQLPTNPHINVPDKLAPFVPVRYQTNCMPILTSSPKATNPSDATPERTAAPKRRLVSRNVLPGIQGPKATTFVLDDPEKLLREAASLRRSRSPTKPNLMLQMPHLTLPAPHEASTGEAGSSDSSPLSSAPLSPLSKVTDETVDLTSKVQHQVPQLDGLSEFPPPTTLLCPLRTPSPTKSIPPQHPDHQTPQASQSPTSKKRKVSHRGSYAKPPRSPGRLKTLDNPPLNNDCVIAFAESANKDEERGVLRQIKGERQGIFREDYVALAVRFFVAGD